MKFNYKFSAGDKVYITNIEGSDDTTVYTIARRCGSYSLPAYFVEGLAFPISEDKLVYACEPENDYDDTDPITGYTEYLHTIDEKIPDVAHYSRNLNLLSLTGKLPPTYNREKEIETIKTILLRRMTPNPLLIGKAGCGKTAIVEAVAKTYVDAALAGEKFYNIPIIYDLSLSSLLSGTKYRGDFEQRLDNIIKSLTKVPNIIIFIDEIHILNTTGNADGAISAGQQLKPALARGEFRCIGATTDEEYKEHVATDKALARRFSLIKVLPLVGAAQKSCISNTIREYGEYFNIDTSEVTTETMAMIIKDIIPDTVFPNNVINIIDETLAIAKYHQKKKITDADIKKTVGRQYNIIVA